MKKTEHLKVLIKNVADHPHCKNHGPSLLFQKRIDEASDDETEPPKYHEFYACSAIREKDECPIILKKKTSDVNQYNLNLKVDRKYENYVKILTDVQNEKDTKHRGYCGQCKTLVLFPDFDQHEKHLNFKKGITDYQLKCPTQLLPPLSNDSKEAQYFFTTETLVVLSKVLRNLKFKKIICIGAPRLHEFILYNKNILQMDSILLDLDDRLQLFYADKSREREFFLYNMFNNYFLDGIHFEIRFRNFLRDETGGEICLFTDPPFGCRTEPLVHTIKTIAQWYKDINHFSQRIFLSTVWIFPYFMEQYIRNEMPEMEMCPFKINYTNHKLYHNRKNGGGRLEGSPVRFFTNVPLEKIELSETEAYWWCKKCKQWRGNEDKHCTICEICPSKNGASYVHCVQCAMCVKPNYRHCVSCQRCTQVQGHSCKIYQRHLTCRICQQKGHTELKCLRWINGTVKGKKIFNKYLKLFNGATAGTGSRLKTKMCLICGCLGKHNELKCPKRSDYLKEKRFCNEIINIFSK